MYEPRLSIRSYGGASPRFRRHDAACVRVAQAVGGLIRHKARLLHVAHVGSTAVPLCRGEGVVDLAVCYPPGSLAAACEIIDGLGFERRNAGHPYVGARAMRVGAVRWNGRLYDLHVYVVECDGDEHRGLIAWRERLRREPELRLAYEAEKRRILAVDPFSAEAGATVIPSPPLGERARVRGTDQLAPLRGAPPHPSLLPQWGRRGWMCTRYTRAKGAFIERELAAPPTWTENGVHLRRMLLAWRRADLILTDRLARTGGRGDSYAEALDHARNDNADRLVALLDGLSRWPGRSLVSEDGAEAAWHIAQHAVSRPAVQRRCLALLADAAESGEVERVHAALLTDRVRFNEGRPQLYGTVLDWEGDGRPGPGELEAPETVEERRKAVGLPSLAGELKRARRAVEHGDASPPPDLAAYREQHGTWARATGWRDQ